MKELRRCGNCRNSEEVITPRGYESGFFRCAFEKRHRWYSGWLECQFSPDKFERAEDMSIMTVTRGEDGKLIGFSQKDKRAYSKFRKAIEALTIGELFTLSTWFPRNPKLHKLHFAVINELCEAQEQFDDTEPLRKWLYVGAGYAEFLPGPKGKMVAIPKSISYDQIDDADFSELHGKVVDFMRTQYCQGFLWPHLEESKRSSIIELIVDKEGATQ